jgi:hypothetical protein
MRCHTSAEVIPAANGRCLPDPSGCHTMLPSLPAQPAAPFTSDQRRYPQRTITRMQRSTARSDQSRTCPLGTSEKPLAGSSQPNPGTPAANYPKKSPEDLPAELTSLAGRKSPRKDNAVRIEPSCRQADCGHRCPCNGDDCCWSLPWDSLSIAQLGALARLSVVRAGTLCAFPIRRSRLADWLKGRSALVIVGGMIRFGGESRDARAVRAASLSLGQPAQGSFGLALWPAAVLSRPAARYRYRFDGWAAV